MASSPAPRTRNAAHSLNTALDLHRRGKLADAIQVYRRLWATHRRQFDVPFLLGTALAQSGAYGEGLSLLDQALQLRPLDPGALDARGNALAGLGRFSEAVGSYDEALRQSPSMANTLHNRGVSLAALGRSEEALASYEQAIALNPAYVEAHNNRGNVLAALRRDREALASYDRALEGKRDFFDALVNRSIALRMLHRFEEALDSSDDALRQRPLSAEAHGSRAAALASLGRYQEARTAYEHALRLNPGLADARWNSALLHLLRGEYRGAWAQYESRWQVKSLGLVPRFPNIPAWNGRADVRGRTLLLHAEQGYGDTIQFCRYASVLRDQGARVVLEVPASLVALLRSLDGPAQVITQGTALPEFDMHCPLPSVACALGTDKESIPARYRYLSATTKDLHAWAARLGPRHGLRVGIVWSGNPAHRNDARRSMRLTELMPLGACGVELISLQKMLRAEDVPELPKAGFRHFAEHLTDFAQTAALIAHLDLVITVDTAVAHLAGAIGADTWIMLPNVPDWRWLLDRDDSPWYPTVRLWRQDPSGCWGPVIAQIVQKIRAIQSNLATKGPCPKCF